MAMMPLEKPGELYFVKNSGDIILGKNDNEVVVTTEDIFFQQPGIELKDTYKLPSNHLLTLRDDLTYSVEKLEKKMTVERKPKAGYDFIFEEEVYESADAVNSAISQKFISSHQVYLGGFEPAKEELKLVQNLIINATGSSRIAAEYGAYIMKQLHCFNTVKVFDSYDIKKSDLEQLKFGGLLTLS